MLVIDANSAVETFQSVGTYFRAAAGGVDDELVLCSLVLPHGQRELVGLGVEEPSPRVNSPAPRWGSELGLSFTVTFHHSGFWAAATQPLKFQVCDFTIDGRGARSHAAARRGTYWVKRRFPPQVPRSACWA